MPEKYQNKYRIKSARLGNYDYSRAGLYFVTICTHNREHYFGEIINGKMKLSNIGVIADLLWYEIKNHSKNIKLHQFVVMPNHIHGIIEILDGGDPQQSQKPILANKSSKKIKSPLPTKNQQMTNISPKSGTLGRIIGSYKSAVMRHVHRFGYEFDWQSRFYDHIVRDKGDFNRIAKYIDKNPSNWKVNRFFYN